MLIDTCFSEQRLKPSLGFKGESLLLSAMVSPFTDFLSDSVDTIPIDMSIFLSIHFLWKNDVEEMILFVYFIRLVFDSKWLVSSF